MRLSVLARVFGAKSYLARGHVACHLSIPAKTLRYMPRNHHCTAFFFHRLALKPTLKKKKKIEKRFLTEVSQCFDRFYGVFFVIPLFCFFFCFCDFMVGLAWKFWSSIEILVDFSVCVLVFSVFGLSCDMGCYFQLYFLKKRKWKL